MQTAMALAAICLCARATVSSAANAVPSTEWAAAVSGNWIDYTKWSGDAPCVDDVAYLPKFTDDANQVVKYDVALSAEKHPIKTLLLASGGMLRIPKGGSLNFGSSAPCRGQTGSPTSSPTSAPTTSLPTAAPTPNPTTAAPTTSAPTPAPTSLPTAEGASSTAAGPTTEAGPTNAAEQVVTTVPADQTIAAAVKVDKVEEWVTPAPVEASTLEDASTAAESLETLNTELTTLATAKSSAVAELEEFKTQLATVEENLEAAKAVLTEAQGTASAPAAQLTVDSLVASKTQLDSAVLGSTAKIELIETSVAETAWGISLATSTLCTAGTANAGTDCAGAAADAKEKADARIAALEALVEEQQKALTSLKEEYRKCANAKADCSQISKQVLDMETAVTAGKSRQAAAAPGPPPPPATPPPPPVLQLSSDPTTLDTAGINALIAEARGQGVTLTEAKMKEFDADGDGVLSSAEKLKLQEKVNSDAAGDAGKSTEAGGGGGGGGGMLIIVAIVVVLVIGGGVVAFLMKGKGGDSAGSADDGIRQFDNPLYDEAPGGKGGGDNDGYLDVEVPAEGLYDEPIIGGMDDPAGFGGADEEDD